MKGPFSGLSTKNIRALVYRAKLDEICSFVRSNLGNSFTCREDRAEEAQRKPGEAESQTGSSRGAKRPSAVLTSCACGRAHAARTSATDLRFQAW